MRNPVRPDSVMPHSSFLIPHSTCLTPSIMDEDQQMSPPEPQGSEGERSERRRRRRRGGRGRREGTDREQAAGGESVAVQAPPGERPRRRGEPRRNWREEIEDDTDFGDESDEESKRHPKPAREPKAGTRFSASEIHDNVASAADEELERPASELAWSSLEAGLAIGFSALAAAFLSMQVSEEHRTAAVAAGYPLGFILVVLARSQLFTENTLEPVVPFLDRRDRRTFRAMMRVWGIVLALNLVGALLFAFVAARTEMLEAPMRAALDRVSEEGTRGGFALVFYKAIFAGWLIALMAWLIGATHSATAQILLVWLTTAPIAAFGFKHSIAGSTEAFYRAFRGTAGWWEMGADFIIPAILGNIVGGIVLVALLNHGKAGK